MECPESVTGAYLSGRMQIPVPEVRRTADRLDESAWSSRK